MTRAGNSKEKRLARERQARTGEPYTVALAAVRAEHANRKPAGGLLPEGVGATADDPRRERPHE